MNTQQAQHKLSKVLDSLREKQAILDGMRRKVNGFSPEMMAIAEAEMKPDKETLEAEVKTLRAEWRRLEAIIYKPEYDASLTASGTRAKVDRKSTGKTARKKAAKTTPAPSKKK